MKASQKLKNVDLIPIKDIAKVFGSKGYVRKGNNFCVKFGNTGKRIVP